MKKFIILFALIAFACAAPASEENEPEKKEKEEITIVNSESDHDDDGSYKFGYENSDGTIREEHANIVDKDTEDEALEISGSYRYIDANGEEVEVHYTAGKNGFVPVGTNIPKEISDSADAAKDLPNQYEKQEPERERETEEPLKAPTRD